MKTYSKPVLNIEYFFPNVAVASCTRDWNGQLDTKWEPQDIACCRNSSKQTIDTIFAEGTSGCMVPCHMIQVEKAGTYTIEQLNALGLAIQGRGGSVTVERDGGYVLCWGSGNHYGPATPEIEKIMINSY